MTTRIVGIDLARSVAHRMGFSEDDISVLAFLVEHHLLLADTATRRDSEDPTTIRTVAAHAGDPARLQLLAARTQAESDRHVLRRGVPGNRDWSIRWRIVCSMC